MTDARYLEVATAAINSTSPAKGAWGSQLVEAVAAATQAEVERVQEDALKVHLDAVAQARAEERENTERLKKDLDRLRG